MEFLYGSLFGFLFGGSVVWAYLKGRNKSIRGDVINDSLEMERLLESFRDEMRNSRDDTELVRHALRRGELLLQLKSKRDKGNG